MSVAIVTGSGGLIGSACARRFAADGYDVIGIDNDMRATFFGPDASTRAVTEQLGRELPAFRAADLDIRDAEGLARLFSAEAGRIGAVIHAAAQPSHDWAASAPQVDFGVNANGTLNLLEAAREHCPDSPFVFCSTNKVYGDLPNGLPLVESETRFDLPEDHRWYGGIDTTMRIDRSLHSLFGVSKAAADLMVQEYGRYFGMPTACFRGGCLTGPAHAGARLHGFLSFLMRCAVSGEPYVVYGYRGKQVRDNIHADDVAAAFAAYVAEPRPAAVYNLGGGRESNCSMLEAIAACERISGRSLDFSLAEEARVGDHMWWVSDLEEFRRDYPGWTLRYGIEEMLQEIFDQNAERWMAVRGEA